MLGLRLCARAFSSCSERGTLFIAVRGPLTVTASPVAEHGLQTRRLSSCGSRAQLLSGMWDLPRPGLEPMSPALAGGPSTTAPPGKPPKTFLTFRTIWFGIRWYQEIIVYFVWCDNGILVSIRKWPYFLEMFTGGCRGKMTCYLGFAFKYFSKEKGNGRLYDVTGKILVTVKSGWSVHKGWMPYLLYFKICLRFFHV